MFDSQEYSQKNRVPLVVASVVGALLLAGAVAVFIHETRTLAAKPDEASADAVARLRDEVIYLAAQPRFAGDDLGAQVFGKAHLELLDVRAGQAYFSLPEMEPAAEREAIARLTSDPSKVVRAKERNGIIVLGDYSLAKSAEKACLLSIKVANVRIDPTTVLTFKFERATYTLSMQELGAFLSNTSIVGGYLNADTGADRNGLPLVIANHGAMVAKAGEASLGRFAHDLTADIPADDPQAREKRVQRLLDFVTNEIEYDFSEASYNFETLKRPSETLMSRRSDCSNKSILLASLLEQTGEDYMLVYMPHHICVAVKVGQFSTSNGLTFDFENEKWVIAESTCPGFKIGIDRLQDEGVFKSIMYVQRPKWKNEIVRLKTGEELDFR